MARSAIAGLTVKIGADTDKFSSALKTINQQAKQIAQDLKTVSQSLKIDPGDTESYARKLELLQENAKNAATKVDVIKQAISSLNKQFNDGKSKQDLYNQSVQELDQALKDGKISQDDYKRTLEAVKDAYGKGNMTQKEYDEALDKLERDLKSAVDQQNLAVNSLDEYQRETSQTAVDVDDLRVKQNQANKEVKEMGDAAESASKGTVTLGDALKFLSTSGISAALKTIKNLVVEIAKAAIEAGKKLFEFSVSAVDMAAQYQDAVETSKRAFQEFADDAVKFAETQSVALGMYKGDMLEAMNSLGLMFSSMGMNREEALQMSEQIVILGADIRAAFGGNMTEILDALSRGFSTSTRNLRQFGVYISEAEIKAYALANGIVQATVDQTKLSGAMIDCEKAQKKLSEAIAKYGEDSLEARDAEQTLIEKTEKLEKIMQGSADGMSTAQREAALLGLTQERLADIQGQANREADKYPALTQRINAALQNMKETIGEQLLPVFESFLSKFLEFINSEKGQAVLESIVTQFQNWGESLNKMLEDGTVEKFFSDMAQLLPEVVEGIGSFVGWLIDMAPALGDLTDKLLYLFGIETETAKTKKALKEVKDEITDLADKYGTSTEDMRGAITLFASENGLKVSDVYNDWAKYKPEVVKYLDDLKSKYNTDLINGAYSTISDFASKNGTTLSNILTNWSTYEPQIKAYAETLGTDYSDQFDKSIGYIKDFAEKNGTSLENVLNNWSTYEPQITTWMTTMSDEAATFEDAYNAEIQQVPQDTQDMVDKFKTIDYTGFDEATQKVREFCEGIKNWFSETWKKVKEWVNKIKNAKTEAEKEPHSSGGGSGSWEPEGTENISSTAGYQIAANRVQAYIPPESTYTVKGGSTENKISNNNNYSRNFSGGINIYVNSYGADAAEIADELGAAIQNKLRISGALL